MFSNLGQCKVYVNNCDWAGLHFIDCNDVFIISQCDLQITERGCLAIGRIMRLKRKNVFAKIVFGNSVGSSDD